MHKIWTIFDRQELENFLHKPNYKAEKFLLVLMTMRHVLGPYLCGKVYPGIRELTSHVVLLHVCFWISVVIHLTDM